MRTALHARYVVGFDGADHVLHHDASVVYEDDRIIHVGPGWDGPTDHEMDLGNALLAPGFIDLDALADIDHALLDSWASHETALGLQWSERYFAEGRKDVFTLAERRLIREFALAQLALHGVTTCMPIASEVHSSWAETFDDAVVIADAAQRIGIRAYIGPSFRAGVNVARVDGRRDVLWDEGEGDAGLADAARFLDYAESLDHPLIRGALLPCRIETLTPELMRGIAKAAKEHDVPVRLHAMQGRLELELLGRQHGSSPLQLIEESGLLGCQLLVPHAIFGSGDGEHASPGDAELAVLAEAGVAVVHCPLTSLHYGMVLRSFDRYRDAGVRIAMGTDSFPPDMIRGMDVGSSLAKVVTGRLDAGSIADYFRAATLGGAAALGRADIGRLAPGAQADIIAIDLSDARMGVVDDPIRTVVMNGSARDVRMTVVAGQTVQLDGTITGIDLEGLRSKAQELFEKMRAAYAERDLMSRSPEQLFPPTFPLAHSD
ncbi:chlorohydrolase family protein [Arthrobacter sp. M4]|uniref:chlorohydrolase family protein n=1 Tax=Arthrobacter sp. M4 TaxID=218160 RepID=UPI001CDD6F3E|nr:chlorohydrolase family protein [Arthrobacter sp. M4]MCA4134973.1 amidohydrolase family protein [Arthrobacter sp. M4]